MRTFSLFNRIYPISFLALIGTETVGLFGAIVLAFSLRFDQPPIIYLADRAFLLEALLMVAILQVAYYLNNLYNFSAFHELKVTLVRFLAATGVAALAFMVLFYLLPDLFFGRGVFLLVIALSAAVVIPLRLLLRGFSGLNILQEKVLVLGVGEMAASCAEAVNERPALGFRIVGFLGEDGQLLRGLPDRPEPVGRVTNLEYFAHLSGVRRVVVAFQDRRARMPLRALLNLKFKGVRMDEYTSIYEKLTGKVHLLNLRPSYFLFDDSPVLTHLRLTAKRMADIGLALLGLIGSLPLYLVVPLLLKLDSRGPVFFTQIRVGEAGRPFRIIKFRTMRVDAEKETGAVWASRNDPRVTRLGYWLRRLRIDEFPQFLNILRGDMSLVGPRPERPEFVQDLEMEIPFYGLRHSVRPGLTGWAQVRYAYGASTEDTMEKLQLDLYYIKNLSFWMDVLIVLSTIRIVLFARGR